MIKKNLLDLLHLIFVLLELNVGLSLLMFYGIDFLDFHLLDTI